MRLDRFIASQLALTRKQANRLIRDGRVTVDEEVLSNPNRHVDPEGQAVAVDDEPVTYYEELTLLMNKPVGVVSSTRDATALTVLDLVPEEWRRHGLSPVGRLDKETTGLLVLTTDGKLVHALTHPRRHVPKVYSAQVEGDLDVDAARRAFAEGVVLEDGTTCAPAELSATGPGEVRVVLREGKYHQVRRMIAACGGHVAALHREAVGSLPTPPDLPMGECRPATGDELRALQETEPPERS
ncbi:MAG: pseudouridine synthase [Myxococcota bacterium]